MKSGDIVICGSCGEDAEIEYIQLSHDSHWIDSRYGVMSETTYTEELATPCCEWTDNSIKEPNDE